MQNSSFRVALKANVPKMHNIPSTERYWISAILDEVDNFELWSHFWIKSMKTNDVEIVNEWILAKMEFRVKNSETSFLWPEYISILISIFFYYA